MCSLIDHGTIPLSLSLTPPPPTPNPFLDPTIAFFCHGVQKKTKSKHQPMLLVTLSLPIVSALASTTTVIPLILLLSYPTCLLAMWHTTQFDHIQMIFYGELVLVLMR
jgi:hypothetical protein